MPKPNNLSPTDWRILARRGITPTNLSVSGSLHLSHTPITALPDNLSVGGSLDLRHTQITALPDNLSVGGSLDLSRTAITALPDTLSVRGFLYLDHTGIPPFARDIYTERARDRWVAMRSNS